MSRGVTSKHCWIKIHVRTEHYPAFFPVAAVPFLSLSTCTHMHIEWGLKSRVGRLHPPVPSPVGGLPRLASSGRPSACSSPKLVQQRPPAAASWASGGSFGFRTAGAGPNTSSVVVQGPGLVPVSAASSAFFKSFLQGVAGRLLLDGALPPGADREPNPA